MKNFEVTINERVIEAINYILASKIELSKANLAERLGIKPAKFSEILNKRMKAGMDIIQNLCIEYSISAEWLIIGKGSMLRSDESPVVSSDLPEIAQDSELIAELRSHIASLNSRITEQEQYIDDLRSVVRTLSK